MEKEEAAVSIAKIKETIRSLGETVNKHDVKIEKLEDVYIALTKMDYRVENVESGVEEIKQTVKVIGERTQEPQKEKALKWDKLIDYLFYIVIAYALFKLGIKN